MKLLDKLIYQQNLLPQEAVELMQKIMQGKFNPSQLSAILIALKIKGETDIEIASFAKVMRMEALQIYPKVHPIVDTCGTGGDGSHTFNISTLSAFITAGSGVIVAKHGNRSVSSKCGSADVIEALGGKLLEPRQVERCIEQVGIGFMFAPFFHPAMKNVAPVRKDLGIKTVFNILGPLTNPANAEYQVIGVFDQSLTFKIAKILGILGCKHGLVVNSEDIDEIGLGKTTVAELKNNKVGTFEIRGSHFGFDNQPIPTVNSKEESAKIILDVLGGQKGVARDIGIINSAAAIYVVGKSKNIGEGIEIATEAIDSGKALEKLQDFINFQGE